VDLLYLHARDPDTPIADSAGALAELQREGKALAIGASNLSLDELRAFHDVCPLTAFQPPYNMLQRQIEQDTLPWCKAQEIAVLVYWPLMKGLLAGKLPRDHVFPKDDGRAKYPMFQGDEWEKNQDFVDSLRQIARDAGCTVAQLAVHWAIQQPGITAALCGAKRPDQIRETAAAMQIGLSDAHWRQLAALIEERGPAAVRNPA
jgi:aryl-alcohol dehydrogenase-like predicted oxidoreductase